MKNFYKNKKIFVTGASGFKGSWLCLWLNLLGADVLGYSLEPNTFPSMFSELKLEQKFQNIYANILNAKKLEYEMQNFKPDIIFHLAAQPLVRESYKNPVLTYQTNVIGTLNVLESARKCSSVKAFVNVTTDKCYENKEINYLYKEEDPKGGFDMYSSSKACVEIMSSSYRNSFLKNGFLLATARAGNVIGGGDWAKDRLIPDCVKAIQNNKLIELRNPNAIRPWQFVLEPLNGYLILAQKLFEEGSKYAQSYNFAPFETDMIHVEQLVLKIIKNYQKGNYTIIFDETMHEAKILMLDITKAKKELLWKPYYNIDTAILKTINWYKAFDNNENMVEFSIRQIKEFEEKIYGKITAKTCQI